MKKRLGLQMAKRIAFILLIAITAMVLFAQGFLRTFVSSVMQYSDNKRRCNKCNEVNFTVDPMDRTKCEENVFLLMLVVSNANNTKARTAIRNTWASVTSHHQLNIKTLFTVGKTGIKSIDEQVREEGSKHNDMIIINMQESYYRLTEKVLVALSWSLQNCHQFKYILKTDDDSFNNPAKIVDFIISLDYPKDLISGRCEVMATCRDEKSKWYISKHEHEGVYLPFFCRGPAYILARKTAEAFYQLSKNVRYFKLEDVYLTGFVREEYGIEPVQLPEVHGDLSFLYLCYMASVNSVHHVTPQDLTTIWDWLSRPVNRPFYCTYIYDFDMKVVFLILSALMLYLGFLVYRKRVNLSYGSVKG